jgi:sugar/nucleoside kinase (ribokinase family)
VDLTTFNDVFPRPGQTIFGKSFDLGFGGKGANQAVAARLCGDGREECARYLLEQGSRCVVITRGERGCVLANEEGAELVPPFPVASVDTTGAGDAFLGSFGVFLGEGHPERKPFGRRVCTARFPPARWGRKSRFGAGRNSRKSGAPVNAHRRDDKMR